MIASDEILLRTHSNGYIKGLLLKPGPGPWTWTLKNLDPEKPGPRKTWTQKNLDTEKPGPRKIWTLKNLDPEKHGINIGLKIYLTLGSYVL